jgi:tRNA A-37 threonylcarbamoyl transferase component Bud32
MARSLSTLSGVFAQRYSIEKTIGRGATATVYLARDSATDRPVAIKVLKPEIAETIGPRRFLREIRLTEGLHHPRILPVLDSGEFEGKLFFVLPYMDGGTVRDRLIREHQLPLREAVEITCTVADALGHAHQQGYVHRDVKPENILLANGEACLADFGIARAIERSMEEGSTSTGIARGTAAYMSPEQASGAHEYDGRSDIYSLGCVLYELIAGVPAFIGATPEAVIAQRFVHPPRELKVYRATVPEKLEAVIKRAMQLSAADRYRTATELVVALRTITDADYAKAEREARWWHRMLATAERRVAIAATAVVVVAAIAFTSTHVSARRTPSAPPDTTHFVLFPLEREMSQDPAWRDDDLLQQAFARWKGVQLVDEFRVAEELRGVDHLSPDRAASLAKSLGAGRYIRGKLTTLGGKRRAYLVIYDAATNTSLYKAASAVPLDLPAAAQTYARLADTLLLRDAIFEVNPANEIVSDSLPATQAFGHAQQTLKEWNLAAADSSFEKAMGSDSGFVRATLWLAQVRAWRRAPLATWGTLAKETARSANQLTDRERRLATALVLLSNGQFSQACDVYAAMQSVNNRDFAAWFGSGECRMMDHTVVPDATSPSRWRFRSSVAAAMNAYAQAFRILPSVHRGFDSDAFASLEKLLLLSSDLREGHSEDGSVYQGRLGMIADTLVMVPYPEQVIAAGREDAFPPGFERALRLRRDEFRQLASAWSSVFPTSPVAKHAVAVSLELIGDPSAVDTLRLARRLASDGTMRLKLAAEEVLVQLKHGLPDDTPRLRSAQALADSAVDSVRLLSVAAAEAIAPLAAISGHCAKVDQLGHAMVPAQGYARVPAALIGDGNAVLARLTMGCEAGPVSLLSLSAAFERTYAREDPKQRAYAKEIVLNRPLSIAYDTDSSTTEAQTRGSDDDLLKSVNAFLRGENERARAALRSTDSRRSPNGPTPDVTFARAKLWYTLGNRERARQLIDESLENVRSIDIRDLAELGNVSSLLAEMRLRVTLATALGDRATARKWGSALRTLWAHADVELQRGIGRTITN